MWKIEINDLFEANYDNLKQIFSDINRSRIDNRFIFYEEGIARIESLGLGIGRDDIVLAWIMSKMQFVEELEGINKYKQLNFVEFLEFIGRLADLIYADEPDEIPLAYDVKVWRLMQALFRGIQKRVNTNEDDANIDSESDYEDDIATEIVKQRYPE